MNNSPFKPKKHVALAEAGRGFAAFYVLIFHIIKFTELRETLPKETIQYYVVYTLGSYGHEAVLFFFLLSGFSIHYSSLDRSLNTSKGLINYYYLRFRRIYPIYLLAIVLTLSLLFLGYYLFPSPFEKEIKELTVPVTFYNLIFLADRFYIEGIISRTIPINGPLWSLSYEVVYYFVYPLYWMLNKRYGQILTLAVCIVISIVSISYSNMFGHTHFTNVLSLYVVWGFGATVAQVYRTGVFEKKVKWSYVLAVIYLLAQSVWVLENATYTLGKYYDIIWGSLFFVMMLYFIVANENKKKKSEKVILSLLFIAGAFFVDIVAHYKEFASDQIYFYIKIQFTLGLFLTLVLIDKFSLSAFVRLILSPFEKVGPYSYALYIIHYPIFFFLHELFKNLGLSLLFIVFTAPVIITLAKVIEKNYQIYIATKLDRVFLKPKNAQI